MQALCRPPWGDAKADAEADGIADDHDGHHGLSSNLLETVNIVAHRNGATSYTTKRQHSETEHQADPVHLVVSPNTPGDQTSSRNYSRDRQDPKTVLWLLYAIVSSSKRKCDRISDLSRS